jgi:7,8-dihydropterin-6-yl-methyl-4-(beta-D-ribofuranosyl)aminobenzene 5'-phosphate synthase
MGLIQNLRITTLAENLVMTKCLGQWGLSFLLEFIDAGGDRRKVVFDTGIHKKSLFYNIKQLKVDLNDVDCLVISHGHADHTAAIVEITEAAGGLKVYAHPHTFKPRIIEDRTGKRRRHGVPKDEGIDEIENVGGEVVLTSEPIEIVPGVWTTGQIQRMTHFERIMSPKGERRIIVVDGEEADDRILDDQALWMDVEQVGPFVITGCAHAGPLNTLLQVQRLGHFANIYGLVGGTHLVGRSEDYLQQTINKLEKLKLSLMSPCHCTGFKATARLWQAFPEAFLLNFSGRVIKTAEEPRKRVI